MTAPDHLEDDMADSTSTTTEDPTETTGRARKGTLGEVVDCEVGATVVNPAGDVLKMGGVKYVLDQPGRHVVAGQAYDVPDDSA